MVSFYLNTPSITYIYAHYYVSVYDKTNKNKRKICYLKCYLMTTLIEAMTWNEGLFHYSIMFKCINVTRLFYQTEAFSLILSTVVRPILKSY